MSRGINGVCNCLFPGGSGMSFIDDEYKSTLSRAANNYDYQQRNPTGVPVQNWEFLWYSSNFCCGDPTTPLCVMGNDASDGGDGFEPWSLGYSGNSRPWIVSGLCKDGSGNLLTGCTVELYLTAGNVFLSQGVTDQNGKYALPTPYAPGNNHTVYANYGSGTYVGSTVDTVQSTL